MIHDVFKPSRDGWECVEPDTINEQLSCLWFPNIYDTWCHCPSLWSKRRNKVDKLNNFKMFHTPPMYRVLPKVYKMN